MRKILENYVNFFFFGLLYFQEKFKIKGNFSFFKYMLLNL